jgi:hypothetical protein
VAVPVTRQAWRAWADRPDPVPPARLSAAARQALPGAEQVAYDAERLAWLSADVVFDTDDVKALTRMVRVATVRNRVDSVTARRAIALSGASTLGKSTAVLHIGRRYDRRTRARQPPALREACHPVVYLVVPAAATPKVLMHAVCQAVDLPWTTQRTTAQFLTDAAVAAMTDLGTSMVIVDEIHNLHTNHSIGAEAATALKLFAERLDATFVYAGIDLPGSELFTGDFSRQITGRVVVHQMRPYAFGTRTQQSTWTDLVAACEDLLVLTRHPPGSLVAQAGYLFDRTGGSLGSLRALLADAATDAILTHTERLTKTLLDATPTDRQADDHRNQHDINTALPRNPRRSADRAARRARPGA